MSFVILGVGSKAPDYPIAQTSSAEVACRLSCSTEDQARVLKILYRRTGIQRRSSVLLEATKGTPTHDFFLLPSSPTDRGPGTGPRMSRYEQHAGKLSLEACARALEDSHLEATKITHLITVSCTGFYAPGLDIDLIRGLKLRENVARSNLGFMGCHAVLNALRLAGAICTADRKARVLIASVELCSLHYQYGWDTDRVVSNALFADGAGAIVGGAVDPGRRSGKDSPGRTPGRGAHSEAQSGPIEEKGPPWTLLANGSCLLPDSSEAMTWRIGDSGFLMTLSSSVPCLIETVLANWVSDWLSRQGLGQEDVKSWAIHPGGPRILRTASKALQLAEEATATSKQILSEHGNMSSATLVFILEKLIKARAPLPCLAVGFGPGLTIEAALFG